MFFCRREKPTVAKRAPFRPNSRMPIRSERGVEVKTLKPAGGLSISRVLRLEFAVLGLGDTNYDKFCETGKWLASRFKALGGTPFVPLGCADEGTGLEDVVEPWCGDLKASLLQKLSAKGAPASATADASPAPAVAPAAAAVVEAAAVLAQPVASAAAVDRPVPALLVARGLQPFGVAVGGAAAAAAACAAAASLPPARLHKAAGVGLYTEVGCLHVACT